MNERVLDLARQQSCDITERLQREGSTCCWDADGWTAPDRVIASTADGEQSLPTPT